MKKSQLFFSVFLLAAIGAGALLWSVARSGSPSFSEHEFVFDEFADSEPETDELDFSDWQRPPGPPRVGIQVGHWLVENAPEELEGLKQNGGGASAAGYIERELNLEIAERVKPLLEKQGILVDILPVTIPPDYVADAFVALHADGNESTAVSGYKAASPRRDYSGKSAQLVTALEAAYAEATGLRYDPNVSRRMRGYYAFNWRRYEHAIHPMTPAAILEMGFLTSPADRRILIGKQDVVAAGIAKGIIDFVQPLLTEQATSTPQ